jgi:FkbM family methyltransferase
VSHRFWPPNGDLSEMIRKHFPADYHGHAIDVGASDGVSVNTTYVLEHRYRWTTLSVEANPHYRPFLYANRAFVEICACGKEPQDAAPFYVHLDNPESFSALTIAAHPVEHPKPEAKWQKIEVPVRTVEQLMTRWEFPKLDCLCIDVEGTELDVLSGCDLSRWKPKVIVVESWDKEGSVHDTLKQAGYHLTDTTIHNYVYVRNHR